MSERADDIREFRAVVEEKISHKMNTRFGFFLGSERAAEYGDVSYLSVEARDMRLNTLGLDEGHRWAVVERRRRIQRFHGSIAIVAVEGQDETLFRRSYIECLFPGVDIATEKIIDDPEHIKFAMNWARSPYTYYVAANPLFKLDSSEMSEVYSKYTEFKHISGYTTH